MEELQVGLLLFGLWTGCVYADTLVLKDGRRIEGVIVSRGNETVVIDIPHQGRATFPSFEIAEILNAPQGSTSTDTPDVPDAKTMELAGPLFARLEAQPPASVEEVAQQLVALGRAVIPCLPVLAKGRTRGAREEAAVGALAELARAGADPTSALAAAVAKQDPELRATALRLLARFGGPKALDALLPLMTTVAPEQAPMLDMTIVALLSRNPVPAVYRKVMDRASSLPVEARPRLAHVLGLAASPHGVPVLARLLGSDHAIVLEIAIAMERMPPRDDGTIASRMRLLIRDKDPAMRMACARALGRLRDVESVGDLIVLLDDRDEGVRQASASALQAISRFDGTRDRAGWEEWLLLEERWHGENCPGVVEGLLSGKPVSVIAATREISPHPRSRDDGLRALVPLLRDSSPEVRVAACAALEGLGTTEAVPRLVDALEDPVEAVRTAAWTALRKITTLDLPPYPDLWRERWGVEK